MLSLFATEPADLEHTINQLSTDTVLVAIVLLLLLVAMSVWAVKKRKKKLFKPVYLAIVLVVAVTTLTISGATVYLNLKSETGGPVHWHADFEVWACGNELELRDPQGFLSNKIGTPTLHEHDDKRVHLEGVPVTVSRDASLKKFVDVLDGQLTRNSLVVPLDSADYFEDGEDEVDGDGPGAPAPQLVEPYISSNADGTFASFVSGQSCDDETAEVQAFVYNYDEATKTYRQTKLEDPASYTITQESEVPPGDCIIFEFAPAKERTNKLCEQYGVRDLQKCARFGVSGEGRNICEIQEVRND